MSTGVVVCIQRGCVVMVMCCPDVGMELIIDGVRPGYDTLVLVLVGCILY